MSGKLLVYGASGHGKVVASAAKASGYDVLGFIDDNPAKSSFFNYEVRTLEHWSVEVAIALGIGDPRQRKRVFCKLVAANRTITTITHPGACIDPSAILGPGTVVFAGSVVAADVSCGAACIINHGATVDHDCVLSDYVHICPGSNIAGNVSIGEGSCVGIGSAIIQGISVGEWVVIGGGSVVISSVANNLTLAGCPAKPLKLK